jgi:hypothetical protein
VRRRFIGLFHGAESRVLNCHPRKLFFSFNVLLPELTHKNRIAGMSLAAFLPQREGDNSLIWREMTPANIAGASAPFNVVSE